MMASSPPTSRYDTCSITGFVMPYLKSDTFDSIVRLLDTLKVSKVSRTRKGR